MKVGAAVLLPDITDVPQPSTLKAALLSLKAANETAFFFSDNSLSMKKKLGH